VTPWPACAGSEVIAMKAPDRLVWSEGMLLSPQHLQALDRSQESLLAARLEAVAPLAWGVAALELDAAALAQGTVRLVRFAGIMPDGLPLAFEESGAGAPPPRAAAELFAATARTLDIHLAVPRERDGVATFSREGEPSQASRFLTATRPTSDANDPNARVPVAFAHPNAVLLLGDEPREDHVALKIAELTRSASGQLAVGDYLPPCLRIGAAPSLVAGVRDVLGRAVAKQRDLAEARRAREASAAEMTGPDVARLVQLLVLNAHLPRLAHLAEFHDASPREAYLALAELAGVLSTFAADADPTSLPRFSHADLRATFAPLLGRLAALLGGMAATQHLAVPLEQRAGGLHLARIQDERILRSQLFLLVKAELPEHQVAEQLPRLCKVASTAEIQGLVQAAAPGLPVQVVHRPPPQLPLRPGVVYFALGTGDRYWQGIVAHRNLAIYLPPPFDPARTKLELLAIPPAPGR